MSNNNTALKHLDTILKIVPKKLLSNSYINHTNEIHFFKNLQKILKYHKVNVTFDVGANIGHYALALRKTGFAKPIICFEPIKKYAAIAKKNVFSENNIIVENTALGSKKGKTNIHVASNAGQSSSLLQFDSELTVTEVGKETIAITTIQEYITKKEIAQKKIFLKMDVQGFELEVLKGIKDFSQIKVIQAEIIFNKAYKKQASFDEIYQFLKKRKYQMVYQRMNGFQKNGYATDIDVIFVRE